MSTKCMRCASPSCGYTRQSERSLRTVIHKEAKNQEIHIITVLKSNQTLELLVPSQWKLHCLNSFFTVVDKSAELRAVDTACLDMDGNQKYHIPYCLLACQPNLRVLAHLEPDTLGDEDIYTKLCPFLQHQIPINSRIVKISLKFLKSYDERLILQMLRGRPASLKAFHMTSSWSEMPKTVSRAALSPKTCHSNFPVLFFLKKSCKVMTTLR